MTQTTASSQSDHPTQWTEPQALELWKYFGGVGAADKNTMVTVESLLLTLSSTAMGYLVTQVTSLKPFSVASPYHAFGVAILGLVISGVAVYVALLYGAYSNWNWAMADAIARTQANEPASLTKWKILLPEEAKRAFHTREGEISPAEGEVSLFRLEPERNAWFFKKVMRWGRPCEPTKRLAPIFPLIAILAFLAVLFNASVAVASACQFAR